MALTISDKELLSLLDGIYENAKDGDFESWLQTYRRVAELISAGFGSLSLFRFGSGRFEVVASNLDDDSLREFDEYYQIENPLRGQVIRLKPGECFSRIENLPDREFEKTEIYQDFFRKRDIYEIRYYALGQLPGLAGGLSFSRPKSNPNFSPDDLRLLSLIVPHFERSFQLYLLLNEAQRENRQMTETLSRIPQSVIVVNADLKVVFRNGSAEAMIDQKDGLIVERGALRASRAIDMRRLKDAIQNVFDPGREDGADASGVIQLSRPSGARPLQLLIAPFVQSDIPAHTSERLALIFVFDPELRASTAEDVLRCIYSLTPAEARVASLIAQGMSTREIGEELGITENTIRTHLKRIFSKTDTSRQTELVNLILNGPANLRNHSR